MQLIVHQYGKWAINRIMIFDFVIIGSGPAGSIGNCLN